MAQQSHRIGPGSAEELGHKFWQLVTEIPDSGIPLLFAAKIQVALEDFLCGQTSAIRKEPG
jgi:hypothetical protein